MKKKTDIDMHQTAEGESEWKEKCLRALADYQNLEKRTREEVHEARTYAAERIVRELLPVIDNLERATKHIADDGLLHILRQFNGVLAEAGVTRISVEGKAFDPTEMECVTMGEGADGAVLEELTAGYRLHGKVIRAAHVRVGSGSKQEPETKKEESVLDAQTNEQ
jgi:molecular chaperone GrpE